MAARESRPPELLRIALTGAYPAEDLERLIGDLDPLARVAEPTMLELDVSDLVSICAPGAAWLVALVERSRRLELLVHAAIVDSPAAGVLAAATDSVGQSARGFRFLRRFETHEQLRQLTSTVSASFVERGVLDEAERFGLRMCLDELAENVVFHAGSPIGGVLSVSHPADAWNVEIGIADVGVGLRTSLQRNPEHAGVVDDLDAAAKALTPRVTATPHRNAGMGMPLVAATFQANGGGLYLRSGNAAVAADDRTVALKTTLHLPGTLIAARLRIDRPFDINVAYTQLRPYFDAALRERVP